MPSSIIGSGLGLMPTGSQLESLGIATGRGENLPVGPLYPLGSQATGAENGQQGTYLVQTSSSPIVCHTVSSQEGNSVPSSSSTMYIGPELPWLHRRLVEKILAGDYVHFNEFHPALGISKPGRHFMLEEEMVPSRSNQGA